LRLFVRKDKELSTIFNEGARVVVRGGGILQNAVHDYSDLDLKMVKLTGLEHEGDRITQELLCRLNSSYILPLDREDAFHLVQKLLAVLDYIIGIMERMILYRAGRPGVQVKEMIGILCDSLDILEKAFQNLDKIERNNRKIIEYCNKIRKLGKKQDSLNRKGAARLFDKHKEDPISLLKWRDIYEHIEMAQDHVQDTTDLLINMCVKYS